MQTTAWFKHLLIAGALAAAAACGDDDGTTTFDAKISTFDATPVATDVDVTADITSSVTWVKATTYHLKALSGDIPAVVVHDGATLTIEAGTHVLGGDGAALVIARGGKLVAIGTAADPIVFSHDAPVGSREQGKWGGIVILGRAPNNNAGNEALFEAFPASTGDIGKYGGNDANDNSGTLKYVRIEFAGVKIAGTLDKEYNGLTLCAVGKGTTIDFVQKHHGNDDGIEFFGGTVDVKHIVSSQNDDDGFDTDNGYNGRAQFVIVQHIHAGSADPNGYESDDHPTAFDSEPRTAPTIYNATIIGSKSTLNKSFGGVFRRGTSGKYFNHIFTEFKDGVFEVRDTQTATQANSGALTIEKSIFWNNKADNSNWPAAQTANDFDEKAKFETLNGNSTTTDPMLGDPANATNPNFKPAAVLTGGATPPTESDGFFDTTATFIGAIGATDWTTGWTAYPQN